MNKDEFLELVSFGRNACPHPLPGRNDGLGQSSEGLSNGGNAIVVEEEKSALGVDDPGSKPHETAQTGGNVGVRELETDQSFYILGFEVDGRS